MFSQERVRTAGKFFRLGSRKFYVRGFSYGPFEPNSAGEHLPPPDQMRRDFVHMRELGANTVRVYFPPPRAVLDLAFEHELRVFVDVPWEKHRCFFEDWDARRTALQRVRQTARDLADHPGLFALSVVNEIPADIVRFYGHRRVAAFIDELLDTAKQESPEALTTFVNFPTTEFLRPIGGDFCCFNVYLHQPRDLRAYLDRLQHIAGNRPLLLGEYGVDSLRHGLERQAEMLTDHVRSVFDRGLAGTFVFAYTDDWFTGGHRIEDWAFGVTARDRTDKPAAKQLRDAWRTEGPAEMVDPPRVSVVVCSYNGAATLRECLRSLMQLDYPDYEVILVDDGSTDETPRIASEFPQVEYVGQPNRGLSVARNVGAERATGQIVAYTDDDCVADEHWLRYLVESMREQRVPAIGGPNITPRGDGWIAQCVAASPGNPSHVMLDDHYAEHVPGCNMAFDREVLLGLGGFDPQFRQAGDDVDLCWRILDAGLSIGYAPAAMVWHHRRNTIGAYARQQKGYGRSEAMVHFKHPGRCGAFGRSRWRGIIYGDGAVGLPLLPETIYHGQYGLAPYQTIYRHNEYGHWACVTSLEWHLLAGFLLLLSLLAWPVAVVSGLMWSASLTLAVYSALRAPLPRSAPWWCRPLVGYLYLLQPIIRGWHRQTHLLGGLRLPRQPALDAAPERARAAGPQRSASGEEVRSIAADQWDVYWDDHDYRGREELLRALVEAAAEAGWRGDFDDAWSAFDVKLVGDRWHDIRIRTATEELGWPRRFTRARCMVRPTLFYCVAAAAVLIGSTAAVLSAEPWAMLAGLVCCAGILQRSVTSRRRCLRAVSELAVLAGRRAGLAGTGEMADGSLPEAEIPAGREGRSPDSDPPRAGATESKGPRVPLPHRSLARRAENSATR